VLATINKPGNLQKEYHFFWIRADGQEGKPYGWCAMWTL